MNAAKARSEAERLAQMVASKQGPMTLELRRRRQSKRAEFGEYVDKFAALYLEKWWKRSDRAQSMLERRAVPMLKHLAIRDIDRQDIARVYDRRGNTPSVAHRLHATLRKLFRWAVSRGDLELSPLECVEGAPAVRARDRYLTDEELAWLWRACDALNPLFAALVRLLMLTGQSRGEVAGLSWQKLDRCQAIWILSAHRTKNDREHAIPLCTQCIAIFDGPAKSEEWPRRGFIFARDASGERLGFSKVKKQLDKGIMLMLRREESAATAPHFVLPWRFHDLRRSLANGLQRQGTRFEDIEAILDHRLGDRSGVAGVYQRHGWHEDMRETSKVWGMHLDSIAEKFAPDPP